MNLNRPPIPIFCIFGIEYPEVAKSTVSNLTLQLVHSFWTFKEFVDGVKLRCLEIVRDDEGDAAFKEYAATIQIENIDILEIRLNTSRGVPKALYYDLLLLYYDERRIGDHLVNDYSLSEHTVVQIFVSIRKERKMSVAISVSMLSEQRYEPAVVSPRVRAMVKLRLVQAWQAAYAKYRDCRIRHVMHPKTHRDNDFKRIGIVEPFRVGLNRVAASAVDFARGDVCAIQVLAYDKLTQQSGWFDILIAAHSTLIRCKERIVEALRQTLDWPEASVVELPHLIARRYQGNGFEDFLLCDDTMTLSYIISSSWTTSTSPRRGSPSTVPMLTVLAFVGRRGRQVSDSKGCCVFQEEEHGTQLLIAAMAVYLNNVIDNTAHAPANDKQPETAKKPVEGSADEGQGQQREQRPTSKSCSAPEQIKTNAKLMAKERRLSKQTSVSRQSSHSRRESGQSSKSKCVIV